MTEFRPQETGVSDGTLAGDGVEAAIGARGRGVLEGGNSTDPIGVGRLGALQESRHRSRQLGGLGLEPCSGGRLQDLDLHLAGVLVHGEP